MTQQAEKDRGVLRQLRRCVWILAAPARRQIEYVREQGGGEEIDELALEFGEQYLTVDGLFARGLLSIEQVEVLQRLNRALDTMSGEENAQLWTTAALRTSEQWESVRELAEEALFHLGAIATA